MPNINPKKPGSVFYPNHLVTVTLPIGAGAIVKGRLYTLDDDGYVVGAAAADGFLRGAFQATRSVDAAAEGTNTAQFFAVRSRIGLQTMANNTGEDLGPGDLLKYDYATHRVALWTSAGGSPTKAELWSKIGSVYEVYTKAEITKKKLKTVSGDIVVVDFGIGVA